MCVAVCALGGESHTVGARQACSALISARLHMDLIGWEIIICWGEMREGDVKEIEE